MRLTELVERVGVDGGIPTVRQLDPYQLGATPTQFGETGRSGVEDPYVPRTHHDVDARLAVALARDRLVLVTGPSKAGKTRSLFEALRHELPDARVVMPTPEALVRLPTCSEFVDCDAAIVVWLENLDRFLTANEALTPALLTRLTSRRARTVVAATLRDEARDRLRSSTAELTHETRTLLQEATEIALAATSDNPSEQATAAEAYPSLSLGRYGLAEALAGAPELLRRYDDARSSNPILYAVTCVAVDWARIGRDDPIPELALTDLALATVEQLRPDLDVTATDIQGAVTLARTPPEGAGRVAALLTTRLSDRSRAYRPFDYLVAADDGQQHRTPRPIPPEFWQAATCDADPQILTRVGYSAFVREQLNEAEHLLRRAVDVGYPGAMFLLGSLFQDRDETDEAENWYRKAVNAGYTDAMWGLGSLLEARGAIDEAESWFRKAVNAGFTDAIWSLGVVLERRGATGEAESCFRKLADTRDADAMWRLGVLLEGRDAIGEAETWYRRAAGTGHAPAMWCLGLLLDRRGAIGEAEAWFRRAADVGHAAAMAALARLLDDRGETREAEGWFRKAGDAGDTAAMRRLGRLLEKAGAVGEAEGWFRKAADTGNTAAMWNLGRLLEDQGETREAEGWFRKAGDAGDAIAMRRLGRLLEKAGAVGEAEGWFRKAADAGNSAAMWNLGRLLEKAGAVGEAESWYRRGADAGSTAAMLILGCFLENQGESGEAEGWFRKAVGAGDTAAMWTLGCLLVERGKDGEAEGWFRRAADAGHAGAIALLRELSEARGEAESERRG